MSKYTKADLQAIDRIYDINFEDLQNTTKPNDIKHYKLIEQIAEKLCQHIQKELGLDVKDPCPISAPVTCEECVGYYKKVHSKTIPTNYNYSRPEKFDKDCIVCDFKNKKLAK